ncbi:MAG: flagellar basal body P-ring formation protein FlgA [Burkholderiales bacterium]|nr:flagellar basal body P-ring formation protein FlgA [Burkholderiales bacterium]
MRTARPARPSRPARAARLAGLSILWAAAGAAQAQVRPADAPQLPPEAVAQALALAREAATALAPGGARITATPGALDARLHLAACAQVEPYLAAGQPAWGHTRIGVRCTEGANWRVFLPVQVQVLAPAVVLRQALPAGARLTEEQLDSAEVDWAAATGTPWLDPSALAGRVLVRPLAAGQALRPSDLQPRQWFATGQTVRIVAAGGGFSVSTEGQALTPGIEGQTVRVRTEAGRVLVGRPTGDGQVEVSL